MEAEGGDEKDELLQQLIDMGFTKERITAVLATTNQKEKAVSLLLNDVPTGVGKEMGELEEEFQDDEQDYKMIFVVRNDLKLTLGKIAEYVATAALQAYKQMATFVDVDQLKEFAFFQWTENGQRKIVVKAPTEKDMTELVEAAKKADINYSLVYDYPNNFKQPVPQPKKNKKKDPKQPKQSKQPMQIQPPKPSPAIQQQTLILGAFGPAGESQIDPLTKHFKLL